MQEVSIEFKSAGLTIRGKLGIPSDTDHERPAILILHGFGSNMEAGNVLLPTKMFNELGYATLRFDMRGCGTSDGEHGHVICLDQVEDTRNAVSFLCDRPEIDPERLGIMGSSFGAAVAVYTAGIDHRIAAIVSASGWGHGERKFRGQHKSDEAWAKFTKMLEDGRRHRENTGHSLMVPRYEIVPVPRHLRGHVVDRSVQMFPAETAQSMYEFRAEDVVAQIAPRPIIFMHSTSDSVTPVEQSVSMWQLAGQPAELHLFADTDHFMFAEGNLRPRRVVADWLARYFPSAG